MEERTAAEKSQLSFELAWSAGRLLKIRLDCWTNFKIQSILARKTVTMDLMNQSVLKTLLISLLVLCGGFTILCYLQNDSSWSLWLIGTCIAASIYFGVHRPKKKEAKEPEVESILPDSAKEALLNGQKPEIPSALKLKNGEAVYWVDQMRTDYYNSKPRVFYLTNQRLVCLDEDFRFFHPIDQIRVTKLPNTLLVEVEKSKMKFKCASSEAFLQAWAMVKK